MHWSFHRDGLKVDVEAWRALADGHYALRIVWPEKLEQLETFVAEGAFRQRLLAVELRLAQENWSGPASMMNDIVDLGLNENGAVERRRAAAERRRVTRTDRRTGPSIRLTSAEPSSPDNGSSQGGRPKASTEDT